MAGRARPWHASGAPPAAPCLAPPQDHHKTAAAELTDPALRGIASLEVHFDMERSGATVA